MRLSLFNYLTKGFIVITERELAVKRAILLLKETRNDWTREEIEREAVEWVAFQVDYGTDPRTI